MKRIVAVEALVLTLFLVRSAHSQSADAPLVLSIGVTAENSRLEARDSSSHFHVVLRNTSNEPQRVWEWWNSWGWFTLSFDMSDSLGNHWTATRLKRMAWSRNFPSFETIDPGKVAVVDVYFGDNTTWEGFPLQKGQLKDVRMKAIFEVRESPETREHKVWTGRVESDPADVTFVRWR